MAARGISQPNGRRSTRPYFGSKPHPPSLPLLLQMSLASEECQWYLKGGCPQPKWMNFQTKKVEIAIQIISSINIYLGIIQCSVRPINEMMIEISKCQKTCQFKNMTRTHCPMNCRRHKSATGVQASGHLVVKRRKL